MLKTATTLIFLVLSLATSGVFASWQDAGTDQEPAGASEKQVAFDDLPWPVKLGLRSAILDERIAFANQVVLVPDLATWLDEVSRWKLKIRWPVLIEDDLYTPLFVRAFNPKKIIRRDPIGKEVPSSAEERERLARSILYSTWSGKGLLESPPKINDVYRGHGWTPQGIVATSFDDPAWPAALALAVGRGQLLRTLDGDFGPTNGAATKDDVDRLERSVEQMFLESGWTWEVLGDDLDALTLCRQLPVRAKVPLPKSMRIELSGVDQNDLGRDAPVALTDLLCRNVKGARFAVTGWIWGSQTRSIYMAMCSLFLNRDSVLLVNAYSQEGQWRAYSISEAGESLMEAGFSVPGVYVGESATRTGWQRLNMGGPQADVLFLNTSGNPDDMNLAKSTKGYTRDIPSLSKPLALYMIHSFSLHRPDDLATIGGRWLNQGVYAYVGSCDEPYLHAFIPPKTMVDRIINFVPFLTASRTTFGEMKKPWRVVTIGDPLMLINPPPKRVRQRVVVEMPPIAGETNLRLDVLKRLRESPDSVDARTIRDLQLLSQDQLARRLWGRLLEGAPNAAQAEAIMPLLFAQKDATSFLTAYRLAGEPSGHARDMLWTLFLPRINSMRSAADVSTLQRAYRERLAANDLAMLLPAIGRLQGQPQRRVAIVRALEIANNETDRQGLRALLNKEGS